MTELEIDTPSNDSETIALGVSLMPIMSIAIGLWTLDSGVFPAMITAIGAVFAGVAGSEPVVVG